MYRRNIHTISKKGLCACILLFILHNASIHAQLQERYLVCFKDKQHSAYTTSDPHLFLSSRAIARRVKYGIPVTHTDIPVSTLYLDSIENIGAHVLYVSKWLNNATIEADSAELESIRALDFITSVQQTSLGSSTKSSSDKLVAQMSKSAKASNIISADVYGYTRKQIEMHNGQFLHDKGLWGDSILIAVLDAGFYDVDSITAFDSLRTLNRIVAIRNIYDTTDVFSGDSHGMKVLSTIAGNIPGLFMGSAPRARYVLLRTEFAATEYITEEDAWVAGAEFADSIGVDLIHSSLGYFEFDDTLQNHVYADMDGNTSRITRAADIAVSKGMIVVNSAGNEGAKPWHHILAPADGDSVISVGAVDTLGVITNFSSAGPSYDGRVKPDVVSVGKRTCVINTNGSIGAGDGTSFSAPLLSGLIACLWQAFPHATPREVTNAVINSADKFLAPDSLYGYGLPDFEKAYMILSYTAGQQSVKQDSRIIVVPNPVGDEQINIVNVSDTVFDSCSVTIYDMKGIVFYSRTFVLPNQFRYFTLDDAPTLKHGMYFLKITAGNFSETVKIVK